MPVITPDQPTATSFHDYEIPADQRDAIRFWQTRPRGLDPRYASDDSADTPEGRLRFQAREGFIRRHLKLADDARKFYLSRPAAPPPTLPPLSFKQPPSHALTTVFSRYTGLSIGEAHHSIWSKRFLIENLGWLKYQGVSTLYLEHLLSDLHQADLDLYLSSPEQRMPKGLLDYLQNLDRGHRTDPQKRYTFLKLVEAAKQNGVRVVALDCIASYNGKGVEIQNQRQSMMNYFAYQVIRETQAQAGAGKWVALMGNTHTNLYEDIPGVAELTGTIGLRVQTPESESLEVSDRLGIELDRGELFYVDRSTVRLKSDLLLTNRPTLSPSELQDRLAKPGQFAILLQPESATFTLWHRSSSLDLVCTPIQRDALNKTSVYLERPSWPQVHLKRFQDIDLLGQALGELLGMSNAWKGLTPHLPPSATADASESHTTSLPSSSTSAPATDETLIDPVVPTEPEDSSRHQQYLLPADLRLIALQLEASGQRLDQQQRGASHNEKQQQALESFSRLRTQLAQDAERFFASYPALADRPWIPKLQHNTRIGPALELLLRTTAAGIVFGEPPTSPHTRQLLIEQLPQLAQAGIKTLYIEHLLSDLHQADLDRYHSGQEKQLPQALDNYLRQLDQARGNQADPPSSLQQLIKTARDNKVQVVALDCLASSRLNGAPGVYSRASMMKYYASRVISQRQSQAGSGQWLALVGNTLTNQFEQLPGIAELTHSIGIRIEQRPLCISVDPGDLLQSQLGRLPVRLQADLILNNSPQLSEAELAASLAESGDFAICAVADSSDFELRHRSHHETEITITPILRENNRFYIRRPRWNQVHLQRFDSIEALSEALTERLGMQRKWGESTPRLAATSPAQVFDDPERQVMLEQDLTQRFDHLRQSLLQHMAWFADEEERRAFRQGKLHPESELSALDLGNASLTTLKQRLTDPASNLTRAQQGALLAEIHRQHAAHLAQLSSQWQASISRLGGSQILPISQNLYLAASERQRGVCRGLAAQLAASWQLDRDGISNPLVEQSPSHLQRYLQSFEAATQAPDTANGQIFGLGLLHWSFNQDVAKFDTHAVAVGLDLPGVLRALGSVAQPASFELSYGLHALSIGIWSTQNQVHFFLADPNFGYAEFNSAHDFLLALELQRDTLQQSYQNAPEAGLLDRGFSLQQYRNDLALQQLLPPHPRGQKLTLADLSNSHDLAQGFNRGLALEQDAFFKQQQQRLSIEEFRASFSSPWQNTSRPAVNALLSQIFARHNPPSGALDASNRLLEIRFKGEDAWVQLEYSHGLMFKPFKIAGSRSAEDVSYLRRYQQFMDQVCAKKPHRLRQWFQRTPEFDLQRDYLTSALPEDGFISDQIMEVLQRSADSITRQTPSLPGAEQDLALALSLEQQRVSALADRFEQVSTALLANEAEPEQWIPLLASAKSEPDGGSSMLFSHRQRPEETVRHRLPNTGALEITQQLEQDARLIRAGLEGLQTGDEAASINGLNRAFAVQLLMRKLSSPHAEANPGLGKNLALALRIHDYANDTQIAAGVAEEASQIAQLVKTALQAEAEGSLVLGASSRLLGKLGGASQAFGVALDIYELTQAQNQSQRAGFGTQLGFDSAGLMLMVVSIAGSSSGSALGASLAGLANPAGVLLAGLGIGITALVGMFSAIAERASQRVGGYFAHLQQAYTQQDALHSAGYRYDPETQSLLPCYPAVIQSLDLEQLQLQLGSPLLYPSKHGASGSGRSNYFFWAGDMPKMQADRQHLIDVRARLAYPEQARLPERAAEARIVVLPAMPKHTLGYDYQILPSATTRHDAGFEVLRQLEGDDFDFDFYIFPSEYLIDRLHFEYASTEIQVRLGTWLPHLQMPSLPAALYGYLHYRLQATSGVISIGLQSGARLSLQSLQPQQTEWQLDARGLTLASMAIWPDGTGFSVGDVDIRVAEANSLLTLLRNNGDIVRIDLASKTAQTLQVDATHWPETPAALNRHLEDLATQHLLGAHSILVKDYLAVAVGNQAAQKVPYAYYDAASQRMLFLREVERYHNSSLALLSGEQVFFFNHDRHKIFRIDPATGEIVAKFGFDRSRPLRIWEDHQAIYLSGLEDDTVFRIVQDQLVLHSLVASQEMAPALTVYSHLQDRSLFFGVLEDGFSMQGEVHSARARLPHNGLVTIDIHERRRLKQRVWLRTQDNALISRWLPPKKPGKPQSPLPTEDITLAATMPQPNGPEVVFFYTGQPPQLIRQVGWGPDTTESRTIGIPHLSQISTLGGNLYANCSDGLIQQVDSSGKLSLSAVDRRWLAAHADWWRSLEQIEPSGSLSILDLKRADGSVLPAWFSGGRVVLAANPLSANTQLLGLSPSGEDAWLLDSDTLALYRQPLLTTERLQQGLGSGLTLAENHLPSAEKRQQFSAFEVQGSTLRVELLDGQLPPPISGISQWVLILRQPLERLKISQDDWASVQRIALDLALLPPLAPSTSAMQLILSFDNPLAFSASRRGDDLLLFDRSSGKSLLLIQAYAPQGLHAEISLSLPDGRSMLLEPIRLALTAPDREIWQLMQLPSPD